jgi:hypothetical protein
MEARSENDMASISSTMTEEDDDKCTVEEYFIDSCRYNDKEGIDESFQHKFNVLAHDSNGF